MTLAALIEEARAKDHKFARKLDWWLTVKCKNPGLEWIMENLEEILGRPYVEEAALEETEGLK